MDANFHRLFGALLPACTVCGLVVILTGCGADTTNQPAVPASIGEGEKLSRNADESSVKSPALIGNSKFPVVKFATSVGVLAVRLDAEKAPITVDNFLAYVRNGHYDGTMMHQVIGGYIALGGGYTPEFKEKIAYFPIRNEAKNGLKNLRGTIAMARQVDAIDSSTCQFFFNLADNGQLDHHDTSDPAKFGYCVFGEVIEGMDVLDQISEVNVKDQDSFTSVPVDPIIVKSVQQIQ